MGALQDGHYVGTTTQGEPLAFDVVGGGAYLTCLTFKVDSCPPSEITLTDEPITITGVFPIDPDGRVGHTVTGDGIRAVIAGKVTSAGTASGTLRVDFIVPQEGVGVECSSGEVRWTARAA